MKLFLMLVIFGTMSVQAAPPAPPFCGIDTNLILRRLEGIRIPKVEFRDATIEEVIEFLRVRSQQLDPDGQGVNFVLKRPLPAPGSTSTRPAGR